MNNPLFRHNLRKAEIHLLDLFFSENQAPEYVSHKIDTRDPEKLKQKARAMLNQFLEAHPDNTPELFYINEIIKAKKSQTHFPRYKNTYENGVYETELKEDKEYYFELQRWIDCLTILSKENAPQPTIKDKLSNNTTAPLKTFDFISAISPDTEIDFLDTTLNYLTGKKNNISYVSDNVKLKDFKKIFNNVSIDNITPIDWRKSIASLRYFIKQFSFKISNEDLFKITAECFTYKGTKLNYTQIQNAKQPGKDKDIIDKIFKHYPIKK